MLPKASDMSSFTGSQKNALETDSAAPHIVICCPSCSTKFAVESSTVAALEVPRFHCSRCDTVFLMKDFPSKEPQSKPLPVTPSETASASSARWVLADPMKTIENADLLSSVVRTNPLSPSDFSIGNSSWEDELPDASEQAPQASPPTSTPTESISMSSGLSLLTQGQANLDSQKPAGGFAPAQALRPQVPSGKVNHRASNPLRSTVPLPEAIEPTLSAENEELLLKAGEAATSGPLRRALRRLSPKTRGLAKLSWPLAMAMAALLLVSYSARISPRSTGTLLGFTLPSAMSRSVPQLPPTDLTIRDLSLKFVRTPAREQVAVVTGKLFNASSNPISEVTLEALGFNERGEVLLSAKAPLHSALAGEKLSDLERSTIVKFQRALGARDASIAPGELVPFTVALVQDDSSSAGDGEGEIEPAKIRFFSARVFSVR